jgi:two-component system, chemotaxis family, chemotaxis protein CheY
MKTILLVDDSATVRQQVGMALKQSGYGILEADDGRAGLVMLARSGISMVICDINMPRMNGFEMLAALRRFPRYAAIPVIMLTSERHPALVERAKNAGANGWITKPFNAEALVTAVGKLIGA